MMFARTRLITAIGALAASATLLAGCGGTTVTSDEVEAARTTSVAPLDRSATSSTEPRASEAPDTEGTGESGRDASSEPSAGAGVAAPAAPAQQDRGAREISEIPSPQPAYSEEDTAFLAAVAERDIDIEGVEPQLLGTARTVCAEDAGPVPEATVLAVAGQLSAQNRTELPAEEVSDILTDAARDTYCP